MSPFVYLFLVQWVKSMSNFHSSSFSFIFFQFHILLNTLYNLISSYTNIIWAKYKEQKNSRVALTLQNSFPFSEIKCTKQKTFAGVPDTAVSHKSNKLFLTRHIVKDDRTHVTKNIYEYIVCVCMVLTLSHGFVKIEPNQHILFIL